MVSDCLSVMSGKEVGRRQPGPSIAHASKQSQLGPTTWVSGGADRANTTFSSRPATTPSIYRPVGQSSKPSRPTKSKRRGHAARGGFNATESQRKRTGGGCIARHGLGQKRSRAATWVRVQPIPHRLPRLRSLGIKDVWQINLLGKKAVRPHEPPPTDSQRRAGRKQRLMQRRAVGGASSQKDTGCPFYDAKREARS